MKKKILVRAPCLSQSGYGEQSRFALRALKSREDLFDIYIVPINWGKTGWIWEESEFREWMDSKIHKTHALIQSKQLTADISLQITIPNEWEKLAPINIGYTAGIECDRVSPQWLPKGNEMDKILVVSEHAKKTFVETVANAKNQQTGQIVEYRLQKEVVVVHECTPKAPPLSIEELDLKTDFNFLCVSQWGPRKNLENTIKWWIEEFIDQKVGLILKISTVNNSISDYDATNKKLAAILSEYKDRKCKVYLLHGDLSASQMSYLYEHEKIKSLINLSHGEGFGLPLFEAARSGLPIITCGYSGQTDFLFYDNKDYFQKVKFTIGPISKESVWPGVLEQDSNWCYADQGSYKMVLRKTRKNWKKAKEKAVELQSLINKNFSEERLFANFCDAIYDPKEREALEEEIDSLLKDLV